MKDNQLKIIYTKLTLINWKLLTLVSLIIWLKKYIFIIQYLFTLIVKNWC
jgi:uncharacterized membrane protein